MQLEKIPSPNSIKTLLPARDEHVAFIEKSRRTLTAILDRSDSRLLLIVGPCSISNLKSAQEYAQKLRRLADDVSDQFFVVMRSYFEKPRTTMGWKGMLYDPFLDGSHNIVKGIEQARELLLYLAEHQIPAATEFLDPLTARYIDDLITWGCIGARTAESQVHRQFASGLPMPVAFKNSTSGDVEVAVNAVIAASHPHACFGIDEEGHISLMKTQGNAYAHVVLRGGKDRSNYDPCSIAQSLQLLRDAGMPERLLIDCTHGNSMKDHQEQCAVFHAVLEQFSRGTKEIHGVLLESYLFEGTQKIPADPSLIQYGISLTDPCLNWDCTERLVQQGAHQLRQKRDLFSEELCDFGEKALYQ